MVLLGYSIFALSLIDINRNACGIWVISPLHATLYCFPSLEHTRTFRVANSLLNICFGKRMKDLVSLSLSLSLYLPLSCCLFLHKADTIQYLSLSHIYGSSFREPWISACLVIKRVKSRACMLCRISSHLLVSLFV